MRVCSTEAFNVRIMEKDELKLSRIYINLTK